MGVCAAAGRAHGASSNSAPAARTAHETTLADRNDGTVFINAIPRSCKLPFSVNALVYLATVQRLFSHVKRWRDRNGARRACLLRYPGRPPGKRAGFGPRILAPGSMDSKRRGPGLFRDPGGRLSLQSWRGQETCRNKYCYAPGTANGPMGYSLSKLRSAGTIDRSDFMASSQVTS